VLDRGSTFTNPESIELLKTKFVCVATDIYYYEHNTDPVSRFYQKVVLQREGTTLGKTTQGFYIFDPEGNLFYGWNSRDPNLLLKNLQSVASSYKAKSAWVPDKHENNRFRQIPKDAVVVSCFSKILEAPGWKGEAHGHQKIFRESIGREHLWIKSSEARALARGDLSEALKRRFVIYHLNDFTRGEPDLWTLDDIEKAEIDLKPSKKGYILKGEVSLRAKRADRWYVCSLYGEIESKGETLTKFDVVARGTYHGLGKFTKNGPPGDFTLAVAFQLADPKDEASKAPPQGAQNGDTYFR